MVRRLKLSLLVSAALGLIGWVGVSARADIIVHESATMGTPGVGGGWMLSENYFLGSRFHVQVTVEVTKIGAHMLHWQSPSHPGELFGAIVVLSGPDALPTGSPFTPDEVVAKTTFHAAHPSTDFRTPLSVVLEPGDYALILGSGFFGATGLGAMAINNPELPDASFIAWSAPDNEWRDTSAYGMRFVVEGLPTIDGDGDGDGDIDLDDYAVLADCLAGPDVQPQPTLPTTGAECLHDFDFDDDGDVDLYDYHFFALIFGSLTPCQFDADCDDGLFCTGMETCVGGGCQAGTNPCGPGDVCNEDAGICEGHGLEADNPGVDFQDLLLNSTYALVAPTPPGGEMCSCDWSAVPPTAGTFNPPNTCTTDLTVLEVGDFTINVVVSCQGLDPVEYHQDAWARVGPPPDAILDQESAEHENRQGAIGFDFQQQVTAGLAGPLIGVEIWVDIRSFAACQTADFFINKGPAWQTDPNDFETVLCAEPDHAGWMYVDVSAAGISLNVGEAFVIGVFGRGDQFFFGSAPGNPYGGGAVWWEGSENAANDMTFRTYTSGP
ncbi:MAG: hypothetical protein IID40_02570 [Planctomycetes bacterium]|nr:hypothetical protein [Planctomycetota bacterium]